MRNCIECGNVVDILPGEEISPALGRLASKTLEKENNMCRACLSRGWETDSWKIAVEIANDPELSKHIQFNSSMISETQNSKGQWVPSIPLPYYLAFGRVRCDCGSKFRNEDIYKGHYALRHILCL